MEWYYANGGQRVGPVNAKVFEGLLRDLVVRGDSLVWTTGMTEWQPWSQVEPTTGVCAASGGRYLKRDMVPYEGKLISAEQKDVYFQRVREGVTQVGELTYAGSGSRFVAKILDQLLLSVVNFVLNSLLAVAMLGSFLAQARPEEVDPQTFLAYQAVTILVNFGLGAAYSWYFLTRFGATPGKMALGIKVVRPDGGPISSGRAVGRFFAEMLSGMILGIGYLMAFWDEEKRTLHDRMCDTRVVKAR